MQLLLQHYVYKQLGCHAAVTATSSIEKKRNSRIILHLLLECHVYIHAYIHICIYAHICIYYIKLLGHHAAVI